MPTDTDQLRQQLIAAGVPEIELLLNQIHGGQIWDTKQLQEDFEVLGFAAPFVVVIRRSDRQRGCLMFNHYPRYYFNFDPTGDKG